MEDIVHAVHGVAHALRVAHVADEEAHLAGQLRHALLQAVTHVVLLLLVAREHANLAEVGPHEVLEHGVAEATRAAGNHEGLACKGGIRAHLFLL